MNIFCLTLEGKDNSNFERAIGGKRGDRPFYFDKQTNRFKQRY